MKASSNFEEYTFNKHKKDVLNEPVSVIKPVPLSSQESPLTRDY